MAGFEDVQAAQEKAEQAAADWASKFEESGQRVATAAQQSASVVEFYTDPEKFKEAGKAAEQWGVDVDTAILAMSGNQTSLQVVKDSVDGLREASEKQGVEARKTAEANGSALLALTPLERKYQDAKSSLDLLNDATSEGARRADGISASLYKIIDDASGASVQVDKLGNKIVTLPDDTQVFIDAKTGQASQNLDNFKGDLDKVPSTKAVTVKGTVDLDESALNRSRTIRVGVEAFTRNGTRVF